jgi:DNA-binding SARP family transcriptional activator
LEVQLLGGLALRLGEAQLPRPESARAESLLAFLILHRDAAQPRQRVAFTLWPDSTEHQARTNLRHVLHNLRRALPEVEPHLEVGQRTLRWQAGPGYRLDVDAFERALRRAAAGEGDEVSVLQEAVEVYRGDLLEGCDDEWLLEERERLRQRFLETLERLAELLGGRGEHARAIPHVERLVRQDPLRESGYRLLMRLYDAVGDRAHAVRVYHACAAELERELGLDPSPLTREVYEALLPGPAEAPARLPHGGQAGTLPLVGRAAERARLAALWHTSESGRAQLVLVGGEPGIGKTRLVEELRSWCVHRGTLTAEARSYESEGALAYGPIVAWLRSEALAGARGRLDRGRLSELRRLLPELGVDPDLDPPPALPEGEQRHRLFDALVRAILAPGAPLLLIADDLQWADPETLRFLHYLLRAEPAAPLLIAATARRADLDPAHPLVRLLAGLRAMERVAEIDLPPLARQETATLAERLAGRAFDAPIADRLFAETEGNPLFVVEALRAGWRGRQDQPWMTPKVQTVIESRLEQLSPAARELVEVAATIGREFRAGLLAAAGDVGGPDLLRGLDELWRRRLIREQGRDSYDFSHDKVREVAYLGIGPARRRQHHLRIAMALEDLHAADPESVSPQLASHYDQAGAADAAVRWYARAAEGALRLYANTDAARLFGRAVDLLGGVSETDDRDRRELGLMVQFLVPLASIGGATSERLVEAQRRAMELAQRLGVEPEPPLLRSLAITSLSTGQLEEAERAGEHLHARGERDADDVLIVEAHYALGVAAFWQGRLERAREHLEAAVRRYRPEQRATHIARYGLDPKVICLSRLGNTLGFLGRAEEAARARDAALALAEEIGEPGTATTALTFAALLSFELRDEDGLRRHTAALARWRGDDEWKVIEASAAGFGGYVDVLDGRGEQGRERIERALSDLGEFEHAPGQHALLVRLLLEACVITGEAEAGLTAADRSRRSRAGFALWEAEVYRLRAGFLAALGAPEEEVDAGLAGALAVARRQGARVFELRAGTGVLRRALEVGDAHRIGQARRLLVAALRALPGDAAWGQDREVAEALLAHG